MHVAEWLQAKKYEQPQMSVEQFHKYFSGMERGKLVECLEFLHNSGVCFFDKKLPCDSSPWRATFLKLRLFILLFFWIWTDQLFALLRIVAFPISIEERLELITFASFPSGVVCC